MQIFVNRGNDDDEEHDRLASDVLEQLAKVMYAADEIRTILQRSQERSLDWLEPRIAEIYDDVNNLMKRLSN